MDGHLIASSKDTDRRVGVVAGLGLALVIAMAAVCPREPPAAGEPASTLVLSAQPPEFVRPPATVVVDNRAVDSAAASLAIE